MKMIKRLMMKEVDPQIYRILDEKGKPIRFPKSSKGFLGDWAFLGQLEKFWIDDKRGQIVFCRFEDPWIDEERGGSSDLSNSW